MKLAVIAYQLLQVASQKP